jgi:hypothetical protein
MIRGRLKDKDRTILYLQARIEKLEREQEEHYDAHFESRPAGKARSTSRP